MARSFYWRPTYVTPVEPEFTVIITIADSFKKDYQLLDTNSMRMFDLSFSGVSDSGRNAIAKHHSSAATGPYAVFAWTTVPSYLNSGSTLNVRYIAGSFKQEPQARSWDLSMSFEVDV